MMKEREEKYVKATVRATTPGLVLAPPLTRSNCVILNKLPSLSVLSAPTKYYNSFLPTEPLQS